MMNAVFAILLVLLFSMEASAVCPICTVAVGVGVGILRSYGVDDVISGLWYGGLIVSSILWMIDWLEKRGRKFANMHEIVAISFILLFVLPLYPMKLIGMEGNVLFGVDRLLVGIILGMVVFILSVLSDRYLRTLNNDKRVFPGQKVVIPLTYLIVSSVIMWLVIGILR